MTGFFQTQELIQAFEPAFTPDLFQRSALIVGLGGNGTHVALAAARMGFARIIGIDCDVVSDSNLSRQVLYTRQDVGRRKADAALDALQRHNLRSVIETHHLDILSERRKFGELVTAADVVFVVLDQPGTTFFAVDALPTGILINTPATSGNDPSPRSAKPLRAPHEDCSCSCRLPDWRAIPALVAAHVT